MKGDTTLCWQPLNYGNAACTESGNSEFDDEGVVNWLDYLWCVLSRDYRGLQDCHQRLWLWGGWGTWRVSVAQSRWSQHETNRQRIGSSFCQAWVQFFFPRRTCFINCWRASHGIVYAGVLCMSRSIKKWNIFFAIKKMSKLAQWSLKLTCHWSHFPLPSPTLIISNNNRHPHTWFPVAITMNKRELFFSNVNFYERQEFQIKEV